MSIATATPAQNERTKPAGGHGERTFWEACAETRWGSYITAIERKAILGAHATFARPGLGLEVGCEGGRWCRLLSDLGWQMIGLDVNPVVLRLCQQRYPSVRCVLVGAKDRQFPVESASIDLLVCMEVSVIDQSWFAPEAARVLKPGGKVVGALLNSTSWRGVVVNMKTAVLRRERQYVKAYSSLRKSLLEQGFRFDFAQGCCWGPFGRYSNSRLVSVAARIERSLGLGKLTMLSPWVVFTATRC